MGKLEQKVKIKARRKYIQKCILGTVASAGLLSVAVLAPNAIQALRQLGLLKSRREIEIINNSRKRLVMAGLLKYEGKFFKLTQKGEAKLRQLELIDFRLKRPKRWDGKWRVLIFDIKEKRRHLRDKVRLTLKAVGFIKLQYSVWVYPYDCSSQLSFLRDFFNLDESEMRVVVSDNIGNDRKLRKDFRRGHGD